MTFDDYQGLAALTLNPRLNECEKLGNAAMGMCGESGEVSEVVKKYLYHGTSLDKEALKRETGDVLWYVSLMCECLGITLEELARSNIDKLRARYPKGFVQ